MKVRTLMRELDEMAKEITKAITPDYLRATAERCEMLSNVVPLDASESEARLLSLRAKDIAARALDKRRNLMPLGD